MLVPWLAHHGPFDAVHGVLALMAFVAFCLVAAGTFLVNDLMDRDADRGHPRKQTRPAAQGSLGAAASVAGAIWHMVLGLGIAALWLPWPSVLWLLLYVVLATAYSLGLKRAVLLDVLVLAFLHLLRILFGGSALAIWVSPWLLGLMGFLFLSLAFLKRYAELRILGTKAPCRAVATWVRTGSCCDWWAWPVDVSPCSSWPCTRRATRSSSTTRPRMCCGSPSPRSCTGSRACGCWPTGASSTTTPWCSR